MLGIRPNTAVTVKRWLKKKKPASGSVLVLSNPPYIGYQDAVVRRCLPRSFQIETIGGPSVYSENMKTDQLKKIAQSLMDAGECISYVSQSPYLFNDTLVNNIFLGREITKKSKEKALELLELFGLDSLVKKRKTFFI